MESPLGKSYQIKNEQSKSINLVDLLMYLLSRWKWYVLSVLIFGGYYYYQYSKTGFVYNKSQTVMIKTASNTLSASRIARPNNIYNSVNVNSEILQLKSKELMRNTVRLLRADVHYTVQSGLRTLELYRESPYLVSFKSVQDADQYSFQLSPKGKDQVELRQFSKGGTDKPLVIPLNREVQTPVGILTVSRNPHASVQASEYRQVEVRKVPLDQAVVYFLNNLSIKQLEDVGILRIDLSDGSALRAADLITNLIVVYNEMAIKDKNQVAINTSEFIKERLAIIEQELGSVENSIEHIKTSNQGLDVKAAGDMLWSESRTYSSSNKEVETQLNLLDIMRKRLMDEGKAFDLIPSNTGLVDQNVESLIAEFNTIILKRNRLSEGNSSMNPVIADLNVAAQAIHENIVRTIDNIRDGLRVKQSNFRKDENQAIGKAQAMPAKQRMMLSVERQQKVKEDLYIFLLNRREENAINQSMTDDNIRVIDPADGSNSPVSPSRFRKVALGIAIGLVLPTAIFLLSLLVNNKVRSRRDIEEAIDVPLVGDIPFSEHMRKSVSNIVVKEQASDEVTEAFRIFRTNLGFMTSGEKDHKVITFTSFNVGAGKTFSVLNLGASLSYLKKKVLLLDLDLRKGTLSSKSTVPMPIGITHYLSDSTVQLEDIIYSDRIGEHIDIIPIGLIAPNPVELLLSERLDQLIAILKERYDYIIVDNVPLGIVADSAIVNRITDLSIFVIRSGKMDKRQLADIEQIYQDGKVKNMSILLNGVKFNDTRYGYGSYGYGYGGYGYGYGYGYANKSATKWQKFWSKFF